jgi:hypothetical protein
MMTTFCFSLPVPRTFAHRALCAAAILALPAAEILLLAPVRLPYEPPFERGKRGVQLFDRPRRLIPLFPQLLDQVH